MAPLEKSPRFTLDTLYGRSVGMFVSREEYASENGHWLDWYLFVNVWKWSLCLVFYRKDL